MNVYPKPKWWRLYAVLPLALVLLAGEAQLSLPALEHKLAQIGIVLFVVGLMALWLIANAAALVSEELGAADEAASAASREASLRAHISNEILSLQAQSRQSDYDAHARSRLS